MIYLNKKKRLYCINLDFASRFATVEICCFPSLSVSLTSCPLSLLRSIPLYGEKLIGAYYLPRPCPFFIGSLGSRSIIGFLPRKTLRFNEYYVRMRYPARDLRIIAPNHFCIILQCYNSQDIS